MKLFCMMLCVVAINSMSFIANAQATNNSKKETRSPVQNTAQTNTEAGQKDLTWSAFCAGVSPTQCVRALSEKVSRMQDVRASSYQLARIADVLWERDEFYAREVFAKALEKIGFKEVDSKREAIVKSEIRRRILSLIAKRDAVWAEKLIDAVASKTAANKESCGNETNLDVALDLLDDHPHLAASFATRSLQYGVSQNFITFLHRLRQEDRKTADRLFLQALNQYAQQPIVDAYQLLVLGTYLFTSPLLDGEDVTAFALTRFGNIGVPNITANRQDVSPTLIRAYLNTAIAVMLRPSSEANQQQYKYALGSLLLPKAQEFAPDLVGEIGAATAAAGASVPAELTRAEAFTNLRRSSLSTPAERLENAEKITDQHSRDMNYLDVAFHSWAKKDFAAARTAAAKISEEKAASSLRVLMDFGEATASLKLRQPDLTQAERLAAGLPQGVERAILHLAIGSASIKSRNTSLAYENLQAAAKSARQISDARRPYLLLASGAGFASLDPVQATAVLNEAVQAFNQAENLGVTPVKWEREVTIEPLTLRFPLSAGATLDFEESVQKVAIVIGTDTPFEALKSEHLRAKAFVALAKLALTAEEPLSSRVDEPVVTVGEDGIRRSAAKTVLPVYPEEARKKGIKGVAVIGLRYNGKGDVTETKILQAPDSTIGLAVIEAVRQWKFNPSKLEGQPISVQGKLTFYFVIDASGKGEVRNPRQYQ